MERKIERYRIFCIFRVLKGRSRRLFGASLQPRILTRGLLLWKKNQIIFIYKFQVLTTETVILDHRERFERIRERRGTFSFNQNRMGRFHWVRVFCLIFAAALLSWYARQGGNNPFAGTKTIRLAGGESGYTLMCSAGRDPAKRIVTLFAPVKLSSSDTQLLREEISGEWELITLSQTINFDAFPRPPRLWTVLSQQPAQAYVNNVEISADSIEIPVADSSSITSYNDWPEPIFNTQAGTAGRMFWQTVYPFGDSIRAVLLTVDKTTTLVCDSSVFTKSSKETRSQFKEKLDLLIIPSASYETAKQMREIFRPRFVAVIPPCSVSAETHSQNIICVNGGESWEYRFKTKSGRFRKADQE